MIGLLPWSNWPQCGYVTMLRHVVWLWPNLWHLKHHNGFGTNGTTGIERYPALIYYGRVGLLNVRISVFIGIKLSSDETWWILILLTAVTPCGERFSINQYVNILRHVVWPWRNLTFKTSVFARIKLSSWWLLTAVTPCG